MTCPVCLIHATQLYYYERWMAGRVREQLPGLPEPVVSAMVKKLDADDLDLLLIHKAGAMAQVRWSWVQKAERGEQSKKPSLVRWR